MFIDGLIVIVILLVIVTVIYLVKNVIVCKLKEAFTMIEGYTNTPDKYSVKTYNIMDAMTYNDIGTSASIGSAKTQAMLNFPVIGLTNGLSLGNFDFNKVENYNKDLTMHFMAKIDNATADDASPFLIIYTDSIEKKNARVLVKDTAATIKYKKYNNDGTALEDIAGVTASSNINNNGKWMSYKIVFDSDTGKLLVEIFTGNDPKPVTVFEDVSVKNISGFRISSTVNTSIELLNLQVWNKKFI